LLPGEGQEHVVEAGAAQREVGDVQLLAGQP
jgi:hypothetical protein